MIRWIYTCEHAGNQIPVWLCEHFRSAGRVLNSHRGYDIGALDLFQTLSRVNDFSRFNTISRLVVDLNRSETNRSLFSNYTRQLEPGIRERILNEIYRPYRSEVEEHIRRFIRRGDSVVHLSVHSFTPVLDGVVRKADIGLMYDPKRTAEKRMCERWRGILRERLPGMIIRMNYPYRGVSDGINAAMRKCFTRDYTAIEIEVNQKHLMKNKASNFIDSIVKSLKELRRSEKIREGR